VAIDATALGVLAASPAVLRALFDAATADAIERPDSDGWSARDVLAHIIDVDEGVTSARIERIIAEHAPFIRSIDPHERLREGGYAGRSVDELLAQLERRRPERVERLRRLGEEELQRFGLHDEAGEISASDIAHQWAYHDLMHIAQIASMLQATLVERMGNTRKFYDI